MKFLKKGKVKYFQSKHTEVDDEGDESIAESNLRQFVELDDTFLYDLIGS